MPLAWALAGTAALTLPGLGDRLGGPTLRCLLVAFALFWVPGYLLARTTGVTSGLGKTERFSVLFLLSLGIQMPAMAAPFLLGRGLESFVPAYLITLALLVLVELGRAPRQARRNGSQDDTAGALLTALVLLLVVLVSWAAWRLTETGSIDRWWYLAYVRGYLEAPALHLGEPFLDGSFVPPRFGFNVWLLTMAVWARQAAVDPVWLYNHGCPLVLVSLTFSATLFFGRSLFASRRQAWLLAFASGMLWTSGSLFPVVTRLPEDKLLAVMILVPVVCGAFLRGLAEETGRWTGALIPMVAVTATTHALAYAIVLLLLLPFAALMLARKQSRPATTAALITVLLIGSIYPAWSGTAARRHLEADGASLSARDHPVVRVHWSRGRLTELGGGLYVVRVRLLRHPLLILALCCLPLLRGRRSSEKLFLLSATLIPLVIAYVPPLTVLAGSIILPWMVYRLLWAVPFAPLLTVAMDEAGRLTRPRRWIPVLLVASLATPWSVTALGGRFRPQRVDLAVPGEGEFREAMAAIKRLDHGAIIAAASEISERIPGLTGKRVLALSDRGTVVFAGSRRGGEARLRSRASLLGGLWTDTEGVPQPTHVLFEPGSAAARYCGKALLSSPHFELCSFAPAPLAPGVRLFEAAAKDSGPTELSLSDLLQAASHGLEAHCSPAPQEQGSSLQWARPGPWAARFTDPLCTIRKEAAGEHQTFRPRTVKLAPLLGNSVDELTISIVGSIEGRQLWRLRTRARVHAGSKLDYALPHGSVDALRIHIIPSFLPFLKLSSMQLTLEE